VTLKSLPEEVHLDRDSITSAVTGELRVHRFLDCEVDARDAIYAALGANRPLLVQGEPGVGKTQLAEAVARQYDFLLLSHTIDARTEARDLMYSFDAVRRLSEAQLIGALYPTSDAEELNRRRETLEADRFVAPGKLWWAFDPGNAREQAKKAGTPELFDETQWNASAGTVLLIDEIDKAEPDVPNGLLEPFGSRQFQPPCGLPVVRANSKPLLIILTTNRERELPDPFLRRCAVLTLTLPGQDDDPFNAPLREFLLKRGRAHFPSADQSIHDNKSILEHAAEALIADRKRAVDEGISLRPGQAEYLDLVRATIASAPGEPHQQYENFRRFSPFFLKKQIVR
jgi:MoxR-like ATPase